MSGDLPQLAMHYWDPTDYTHTLDFPDELKKHEPEEIDRLCFAVNQHYSWNFNFATRWFRSIGYVPQQFETRAYFRQKDPVDYTQSQMRMIEGELNPRSYREQFFNSPEGGRTIFTLWNTQDLINSYKWFRSLVETQSTVDRCTLDKDEIDTILGSKTKNMHYISRQ